MSTKQAKAVKHTPGPWHFEQDASNAITIWAANGQRVGYEVAQILNNGDRGIRGVTPQMEADAQLIAAAPDLLAACYTAYIALPMAKHNEQTNAALKAAIIKAGGRV